MSRCEIDIEKERRELNESSETRHHTSVTEDEDEFIPKPIASSRLNSRDEVFRNIDISLAAYYPHIFNRR